MEQNRRTVPVSQRMPLEMKQNFKRESTNVRGLDSGYIPDPFGQKSELEKRESQKIEEKKQARRKALKKCCVLTVCFLLLLIVLLVIAGAVLWFFTCILGNCPVDCYDCEYTAENWRTNVDVRSWRTSQRHCGTFQVTAEDFVTEGDALAFHSTFKLHPKNEASVGKEVQTSAPFLGPKNETDGTTTGLINMYWYMEETVKNNETIKLVFSDNGEYYAGFGDFGSSILRPKPAASEAAHEYTVFTTKDDPYYFPYYLTRNENASICMFLDVQGAPVKAKVTSTTTEWTILATYGDDSAPESIFSLYWGETPYQAMQRCVSAWRGDVSTDVSWTENFIVGSLSPSEIKTATETDNVLATHYILGADSFNFLTGTFELDEDDVDVDYSTVYLKWNAKQTFDPAPDTTPSVSDGYRVADRNDTYYLDYTVESIQTIVNSALVGQTTAGFILSGGYFYNASTVEETVVGNITHNVTYPAYSCRVPFYCTELDYDHDNTACLLDDSGTRYEDKIAGYDAQRKEVLEGRGLVVQSTAEKGTTDFYNGNLESTWDDLKRCFNQIVNLQVAGVLSATCNLCSGNIPPETDAQQTYICNRWSELSILMPYVIFENATELQILTEDVDAGRYIKNNLNIRKTWRFHLEESFMASAESGNPFVYQVNMFLNSDMDQDYENGVMIGEDIFYWALLEEPSGDITIRMPPGNWFSNGGPTLAEYYPGETTHDSSATGLTNLLFLREGGIYVLDDFDDNPGHVIVRVYMPYTVSPIPVSRDFQFYEDGAQWRSTTITVSTSDETITFAVNEAAVTDSHKISKILVYLWHVVDDTPDTGVTYNGRGDNKYNVEFDFITSGEDKYLLDSWTLQISSNDSR